MSDINIILPQFAISLVGFFSVRARHLLVSLLGLMGLSAEKTLTIKSAKRLSESQILWLRD